MFTNQKFLHNWVGYLVVYAICTSLVIFKGNEHDSNFQDLFLGAMEYNNVFIFINSLWISHKGHVYGQYFSWSL